MLNIVDCTDFLLQDFIGCELSRNWQDVAVDHRRDLASISVSVVVLRMHRLTDQHKLTSDLLQVCLVQKCVNRRMTHFLSLHRCTLYFWLSICPFVHVSVRVSGKFVNTRLYKPLGGISPHLQFLCTCGQI